MKMKSKWSLILGPAILALPLFLTAGYSPYPLDGYEYTGIRRLEAYRLMMEGKIAGTIVFQPGARLPSSAIQLRLAGVNEAFDLGPDTPPDPELQAGLERILGHRDPSYRAALVDITDPLNPRFASFHSREGYIPGSVGKLLVLTGLFNELRKLYPNSILGRERVLRETRVVADDWVIPNSHAVPIVAEDMSSVTHRAIRVGDEFSLWEWVDHMASPSSNAAGSMVWKQVILMNEFGRRYPPSKEEADAFFRNTPKTELTARAIRVLEEPMVAMGLDTAQLRLRTMFTTGASRAIPGRGSYSTPEQLVRWLVKMEQGEVIDRWSSLEMKKLLYFTRRRYRYAYSPALNEAAVYFKSGSLYRCQPEEGFQCAQYQGNLENLMHSVAIVESPAGGEHPRVYLISMMSNVLKVNSANEHAEIGTQVQRLIESLNR